MTPPKLTDEQMNEVFRKAFHLIDSRLVGDQIKFAHAIADLVNRQWTEMLAGQEPVAWLYVGSEYGDELQEWEIEAEQRVCDQLNEKHINNPTKLPLHTHPAPDQAAVMQQALDALEDLACLAEAAMREAGEYIVEAELQDGRAAIAALKQALGD